MGRLIILEGQGSSKKIHDLGPVFLIGRAADCQIVIPDMTVSRRHARISKSPAGFILEHLGSGSPTRVNEQPVGESAHLLQNGDIIRLGKFKIRFEEDPFEHHFGISDEATVVAGHGGGAPASPLESHPRILRGVKAGASMLEDSSSLSTPEEFQKMAKGLESINNLSKAIAHMLDTKELLPEVLQQTMKILPEARRALVLLRDPKSGELTPGAQYSSMGGAEEIAVPRSILNHVINNRETVLSRDAGLDTRFQGGLSVVQQRVHSMMCSPMIWRDEVFAVAYVDSEIAGAFQQMDLQLFNGIAQQSAVALGVIHMHREAMDREAIERDLKLAEGIQRSFLPETVPVVAGLEFRFIYEPARRVGGDFYDLIEMPDGRIAAIIADVSGKGLGAALYMARLMRDLRYFTLAESAPSKVLNRLNTVVLEIARDNVFVTMLVAVVDPKSGTITYSNAGHLPPIVRKRGPGEMVLLEEASAFPLGFFPGTEYSEMTVELEKGSTLVLYTDGLVEAMNPAKEMFGMERLQPTIAAGPADPGAVMSRMVNEMHKHVKDAPQFDDTTILCIGRPRT